MDYALAISGIITQSLRTQLEGALNYVGSISQLCEVYIEYIMCLKQVLVQQLSCPWTSASSGSRCLLLHTAGTVAPLIESYLADSASLSFGSSGHLGSHPARGRVFSLSLSPFPISQINT